MRCEFARLTSQKNILALDLVGNLDKCWCSSLDVNDLHDVGLVRGLFVCTVDANNFVAALDKVSLLSFFDHEL